MAAPLDERLSVRDRTGFLALFEPQPGSQGLGERVFDNLVARSAGIAAGTPGRLRIAWNLPSEPRVVSEATAAVSNGRLAALSPASNGTEWLGEPLNVHTGPGLVVAAARPDQLVRWFAAATDGIRALSRVAPSGLRPSAPLVVLVPADLTAFARYAGSSAASTAAVTVVPGTPDSAGFRVVVNPVAPASAATDRATITHEAGHAGMGSPRLTGTPGWLREGVAESLTARAHPAVRAANLKLARAAVHLAVPTALPDLGKGEAGGYALAQVAVDAMVGRVGWSAVLREARLRSSGVSRIGDDQVLAWYRAALRRLG